MTDKQELYQDLTEWVYAPDRLDSLGRILLNATADHRQRQFLVGNLHDAGASLTDILDLIDRHNRWANYDPSVTAYQARSVVKSGGPTGNGRETERPKGEAKTAEQGAGRYVWRHAGVGPFSGDFCEAALGYAKRTDTEAEHREATFRTVAGEDHTLLVIDMDADVDEEPSPEDLEDVWAVASTLYEEGDWWLVKFSGRKGFHVIDKLDGEWSGDELETEARERMAAVGVDFAWADTELFKPRQLIRCVNSPHLESGLHSVVVHPEDTVEDVLAKAGGPGSE